MSTADNEKIPTREIIGYAVIVVIIGAVIAVGIISGVAADILKFTWDDLKRW